MNSNLFAEAGHAGVDRLSRTAISFRRVPEYVLGLEIALISMVGIGSGAAYEQVVYGAVNDWSRHIGIALAVCALYGGATELRGLNEPTAILKGRRQMASVAAIWAVVWMFVTLVGFFLHIGDRFSRGSVITFALAGGGALFAHRAYWRHLMRESLASGRFKAMPVGLVTFGGDGSGSFASIARRLKRLGLSPAHHLVLPEEAGWDETQAAMLRFCMDARAADVQEILIAAGWEHAQLAMRLAQTGRSLPVPIRLVATGDLSQFLARPSEQLGFLTAVELQRAPLSGAERFTKRALDIVVAGVALATLGPLMALIAIAVRLDSPGPILFRQRRQGFNGKVFKILKFRSMTVQEDGAAVRQAQKNDQRVTRIGGFLRRTSLDELPQLLNVVRGDMSLVGPRPHAVAHDNYYDDLIADYALRRHVKPGLTGWAQVNGCRGETPTVDRMAARVRLDLWYIDHWSFWMDIKILFLTLRALRGTNAY